MKKRIIPCLDLKGGKVVKGINFVDLKEAGNPLELAQYYDSQGADELVLLDISATVEHRKTTLQIVRQVTDVVHIPVAVGGGVASVEDAEAIIAAGASKISVNSAAVKEPDLIRRIAEQIGANRLVIAIDVKETEGEYYVMTHGGGTNSGKKAVDWAKETARLGAGEILLTSMNRDGTRSGFDLEITDRISRAVNIPVVASGGAGTIEDFAALFEQTGAAAGLAAGIFHSKQVLIPELKRELQNRKLL